MTAARTAVAISTYVLRSRWEGTTFVHRALNHRRAITLCCTAKSARSPMSTASADGSPTGPGPSMDLGTRMFPTKPIR